jgi:hypothetical protein
MKNTAAYFRNLKEENLDYFKNKSTIKFSELFKFRGLLGQGTFGVVISVSD